MEDSETAEPPHTSPTVIKKRGIFPKPATNILRAWLFQNLAVSKLIYTIQRYDSPVNTPNFIHDQITEEAAA